MEQSYNPVPLGQANTGSAVVLGPSQAPQAIERTARGLAMAGIQAQRIQALNQQRQQENDRRLAADAAKFNINEDIWLPFQQEYQAKARQSYDMVTQMYNNRSAFTPSGQLAIGRIKSELESDRIKANQLKAEYARAEQFIDKEASGATPLVNAEKAKQRLNEMVYDANGRSKPLSSVNMVSMIERLQKDPEIYNDLPVFSGVVSKLDGSKFNFIEAGKRGGISMEKEVASKAPFELDNAGLPIFRNSKGQIVDRNAPDAKPSVDFLKLYNVASQDPLAAVKLNKRALDIYNQETGQSLQQIPLNVAEFDAQKWESAATKATQEMMGGLIGTKYSYKERLNALPRAPRQNTTDQVTEVYTLNENGLLRIGNRNYKAINFDLDANVSGKSGDKETIIRPTGSLINAETGMKYTPSQQFKAITGGSSILLKLNTDLKVDGKTYKKGMIINPTEDMKRSLQDVYRERPDVLEPVLVQTVSRIVPNENIAVFRLKSDYIDPTTNRLVKKDQTVNAVVGSNNYTAMLNNEKVFEELDQSKASSTEPKTLFRELATWKKGKDGKGTVVKMQGQGGFIDKELMNKFKQYADNTFGAEVVAQQPAQQEDFVWEGTTTNTAAPATLNSKAVEAANRIKAKGLKK